MIAELVAVHLSQLVPGQNCLPATRKDLAHMWVAALQTPTLSSRTSTTLWLDGRFRLARTMLLLGLLMLRTGALQARRPEYEAR